LIKTDCSKSIVCLKSIVKNKSIVHSTFFRTEKLLLTMFLMLQVFDDAYKSQLSCVVVDDIEKLMGGNTAVVSRLFCVATLQRL